MKLCIYMSAGKEKKKKKSLSHLLFIHENLISEFQNFGLRLFSVTQNTKTHYRQTVKTNESYE